MTLGLIMQYVPLLIFNCLASVVTAKLCDFGNGKTAETGMVFEKDCLAKCTCDPSGSGDYECVPLCPLFGVAHPCRKVRPYGHCCKRSVCPENEQMEFCDVYSPNMAKNQTTVPWHLRLTNGERSCNGILLSERHLYAKSDCLLSHNNSLKILDQWMTVRSVQPIEGPFDGLAKVELDRSINLTPKIHEINAAPSEICDKYANFNISICVLYISLSSSEVPANSGPFLAARITGLENCFPSEEIRPLNTKCLELEEETPCQFLEWSSVSLKMGDLFYLIGVTVVNETCTDLQDTRAKFVSFMDICNAVSNHFMYYV